MRMGQGVRTGLGHGGITCVLHTQFASVFFFAILLLQQKKRGSSTAELSWGNSLGHRYRPDIYDI